jgi:hypothetical protein
VAGLQKLLPVGTILMFDGMGWQDNVTMVGWYKCVSANRSLGVPNLESRFIMGSTVSGEIGGSNSVTLTKEHLPAHTHGITLHRLAYDLGGSGGYTWPNPAVGTTDGSITSGSTGDGKAFDVVPAFYTVIYIMKIA